MASLSTLAQRSQKALVRISHSDLGLSFLEKLPNEVKQGIVSYMTDTKTVRNLALTGAIYGDFIAGFEVSIATAMVSNAILPALKPMAMAIYHAQEQPERFRVKEGDSISADTAQFTTKHLDIPTTSFMIPRLNLKTADKVLFLHTTIEDLASTLSKRIADRARYRDPYVVQAIHRSMLGRHNPTAKEVQRFVKALYIFQLVCTLFPNVTTDRHSREDILAQFWRRFAPWELQQVRVLQYHLVEHIGEMMDTEEDVCCTRLPEFDWSKPMMSEFLLSRGIDGLGQLQLQMNEGATTHALYHFSFQCLRSGARHRRLAWHPMHDALWLRPDRSDPLHMTLDVGPVLAAYPAADGDDGPAESWCHTLLQTWSVENRFYYHQPPYQCDHCMTVEAYVFWDLQRARPDGPTDLLPSLAQMQAMAAETEAFLEYEHEFVVRSRGRRLRPCIAVPAYLYYRDAYDSVH
ncbi:hypothetical protein F4780DRAFT_776393 [Xylariomycetidae sp. FL0641]|nr:hypothetical protein F4780DRAFT_776393 [Xylariomycetidae sp. FL0641]